MALEYNSGGTAVTDRKIYLADAVTLGGESLYMGRVAGLAASTVVGTASSTYGVWSTINKGGTRYRVITTGVPGTSADVLWDLQAGRVYRTVSSTLFTRYWKYADLINEGRVYNVSIPFDLTGTADDVAVRLCPWDVKWGEYQISVDGNRPAGTLDMALYKATSAAGASAHLQLSSSEAKVSASWKTLNSALQMDTRDKIVIRAAGAGYNMITVTLREKME